MAKKTYKLNNENKLNNKSELQSKSDSVVLTNYKNFEDNFFIEEKNQKIKDTSLSVSIDQILSRKNEMIKKLEDLEQIREKFEAEQKNLSEMYTKLEKLQEVDKNKLLEKEYKNALNLPLVVFDDSYVKELQEKLEKEKKVLEQSRENLEAEQKNLSEMYTKLEKLQEVDKNKLLEKEYKNALNLPLVVFDDSYVKELQEKLEKEKKVLEQSRENLEAEQKNLSEMYTKLEKLQEVDKNKLLEKEYKNALNLPLVVFDDSYVKELQEKLEKEKKVLEQSRENLEAEQKNLSEKYTKLIVNQEFEKKEFEKIIKEFEQSHKHHKDDEKRFSKMYTSLENSQEANRNELDKEKKVLEQSRKHFEAEQKYLSEEYINLLKYQEANRNELDKEKKVLEQSREKLETDEKHLLEKYTKLIVNQEFEKNLPFTNKQQEKFDKINNFEYNNSNKKELEEELEI